MTVNMKIDIVKANQRGLAIGLNEFAGYSGVALTALASDYIASLYALRLEPFYFGVILDLIGLGLSFFVKDTEDYLILQAKQKIPFPTFTIKISISKNNLAGQTLSSCSLAGLATNLKDGMVWGLFPLFLRLLVYR